MRRGAVHCRPSNWVFKADRKRENQELAEEAEEENLLKLEDYKNVEVDVRNFRKIKTAKSLPISMPLLLSIPYESKFTPSIISDTANHFPLFLEFAVIAPPHRASSYSSRVLALILRLTLIANDRARFD